MFKIVGITSCPAGVAHTYMTAKALVNQAKENGMEAHFEKQGQLGPEDVVSQQEFDEADAIVICCGVLPLNPERFEKYADKTVSIDYNAVFKNKNILIEALKEKGLI